MLLIYQSYRTEDVPPWISSCMNSVKKWAGKCGYDYRFIDDTLFDYAPDWYRERVSDNIQLVSDLVRLILARKFLNEGYERVVWIDADMLIFDPRSFSLNDQFPFCFCRETWLDEERDGKIIHQTKVNNSISSYQKGHPFLDFYIDACLKIVAGRSVIEPVTVGTEFLTSLNHLYPLPLMHHVGIISPALVYGLIRDHRQFVDEYFARHGNEVYAANLCGSMENEYFRDLKLTDQQMEKVVEVLLRKGLMNVPRINNLPQE